MQVSYLRNIFIKITIIVFKIPAFIEDVATGRKDDGVELPEDPLPAARLLVRPLVDDAHIVLDVLGQGRVVRKIYGIV